MGRRNREAWKRKREAKWEALMAGESDGFEHVQFDENDQLEPLPEDDGAEAWRQARLGTVRQVARLLQVHPKTVERWRRKDGLPCVRFQSVIRYELEAVLRWAGVKPATGAPEGRGL